MSNADLYALRGRAREIAHMRPAPALYLDLTAEAEFSNEMFFNHPLVLRLQQDSVQFLYDDAMFGIDHAKKVARDAAILVLAEARGEDAEARRRLALLAQLAGLVHDVERPGPDHAQRGADSATQILADYPIGDEERERIARAVAAHEAGPGDGGDLLAAALYDADKFRYGRDIFATAMWLDCDYEGAGRADMTEALGRAMSRAEGYRTTLRTETARRYGPEILDQGREVGRLMLEAMTNLCCEPGAPPRRCGKPR